MRSEKAVKPKVQKRKKEKFQRTEKKASTRAQLEKAYDIKTMSGRILLVLDDDKFTKSERSVMFVVACRCTSDQPDRTFAGEDYIAASASVSEDTVQRAWKSLEKAGIIALEERINCYHSKWKVVDWKKVRERSYRWNGLLGREAAKPVAEEARPSEAHPKAIKPKLKKFEYDDEEIALKSIIATPIEENTEATSSSKVTIDADLKGLLDDHIPTAMKKGAVYLPMIRIRESDVPSATEYLRHQGLTACALTGKDLRDDQDFYLDVLRMALPIHAYAALRLTQHCEREITASSLLALTKKTGDVYSVIEHGLNTESWCSLLASPETRSPAAMLVSQFDAIAESWLANGGYTYSPPIAEAEEMDASDKEPEDDAFEYDDEAEMVGAY